MSESKTNGVPPHGEEKDNVPENEASSPPPTVDISGSHKKENKASKGQELKARGTWGGQLDFILALIGFSVGLGNVWRFPYLCYKNGGGAFLIPYFICLFVAGIPLLIAELSIGQFMAQGGITCWRLCTIFKGIGIASIIILNYLNYYYNIILAWGVYYMFLSFTSILPWSHCNNEWNTQDCLDPKYLYGNSNETSLDACMGYDTESTGNESMIANVGKQICINGTLKNVSDFTPAVEEFWERKILQFHQSTGLEDMGGLNWQMVLCLFFAWILVYLCICKGVKSSGKVVYFTATFPYILLTILLIRAVTLENASDGLKYYITPNFTRLNDASVWMDAATQIFFSYSIGLGTMMALGSYNLYNHNFLRDGIIFACVNSGTSIYAGVVIFSVLGFMAGKQGVGVGDVAKGGPGLAFVVYPEAVAQMPVAPLWAVLFFFMIILLGIDSEFVGVEGFITAIVDLFPNQLRKGYRREYFAAGYCFVCFLVGLSMVSYGGIYLFQLFDYYSASGTALLWLAFFESMAIGWVYGSDRFLRDWYSMLGRRHNYLFIYFKFAWRFLTPIFTGSICIFSLVNFKPLTYQGYTYPNWGYAIGWFFALSSMLMVPLWFVFKLIQADGTLKERWILLTTPKLSAEQQDRKTANCNGEEGINAYDVGTAPNEPPPAYYVETEDKAV
ncbi:sodium- and chloride-dependent GABA transporter 1-like [Amphiura filiformis]|uniref:sodium- and chloride-dependent GABA transporter 1-like n=1 Tax=Amphiura filiformis TaxID=82378 RepID=UPI003B220B5A